VNEHTYWDELAAGYALHGLSPEEEVLFAEHLESCELCAASVRDLELVAAQLGSMAHYRDDAEAPSWESMRSAIISTPQDRDNSVVDLAERRRRRYDISRRALGAAAAAVVVVGAGIATWQLSDSGGSSCSASDGCHAIELDAAGGKSTASLEVRGQTVVMDAAAMSAAPAGKVYVLWQQPSDAPPQPIKEFLAGSDASAVTASLKSAYADTAGFAVSVEPANTTPTSPHNLLASGTTT
jgi:anti-sigma-K factor RskA